MSVIAQCSQKYWEPVWVPALPTDYVIQRREALYRFTIYAVNATT